MIVIRLYLFIISLKIHPTAVISKKAKIDTNVEIGPYSVIGENVTIFDGVKILSHVCIDGNTSVGRNTIIYPFASIGYPPQDLKYEGENSSIEIGENSIIREYVTIHPGTKNGSMKTYVGNKVLLMIGVHIAHDCFVDDFVVMANNATLAGHVHVGKNAVIGGLSAIQQFVRIGQYAMIGGMSGVDKDVVPYGLVMGERATLKGLNLVGLKRAGFSNVQELLKAYSIVFDSNELTIEERLKELHFKDELASNFIEFVKNDQRKALCCPKK